MKEERRATIFTPTQEENEVLQKAVNDVGFVNFANAVDVYSAMRKAQAQES
jgi:hypothetical protein